MPQIVAVVGARVYSVATQRKDCIEFNAGAITTMEQGGLAMNDVRTKGLDEKFCSECGEAIKVKAEICPKCGVRQAAAPAPPAGRNKTLAGLLALFLGGIGIHKFYLGKGFQGLLYLVFCWTIIPAIVGFIEGLNYLLMSDATFNKRYA
jgi:TM2 domain-containing membrane protein YozV